MTYAEITIMFRNHNYVHSSERGTNPDNAKIPFLETEPIDSIHKNSKKKKGSQSGRRAKHAGRFVTLSFSCCHCSVVHKRVRLAPGRGTEGTGSASCL